MSIENLIDSEAKSRKQAIEVEIATLNAKLDATRGYITQTEIQIKDLEREAKELEKIEKDLIAAKNGADNCQQPVIDLEILSKRMQ